MKAVTRSGGVQGRTHREIWLVKAQGLQVKTQRKSVYAMR